MKVRLHKVALQGRWPSKTVTVNDRFNRIEVSLADTVPVNYIVTSKMR